MQKKRDTEVIRTDFLGDKKNPQVVITTYRTRKIGRDLYYKHKTIVLQGTHDCLIVDWPSELDAVDGHARIMADVLKGKHIGQLVN